MKTRAWKTENGGWQARSVWDCGSLLPPFHGGQIPRPDESARGLAQSKTWRTCVAILVFVSLPLISTFAQSYSIDWNKVSGGGGTSTGGVYSVSGTMGQPDAGGPMTGGNYSLTGGFWSLISVVQTAGLPNLVISLSGNTVTVSWPDTASCTLQQNSDLAAGSWVTSGYSISTLNGTNSISLPSPTGKLFFRLKQ